MIFYKKGEKLRNRLLSFYFTIGKEIAIFANENSTS